jgi:hypothetical protein
VDYLCGYLVLFVGSWAAACVPSSMAATKLSKIGFKHLMMAQLDPKHVV